MFTGLIEEIGEVLSLEKEGSNLNIEIQAKKILEDIKLGDSIAIDGTCLSVTKVTENSFSVTAIDETLGLTIIGAYEVGKKVNLERCLKLSDRLGGHIVSGHIDAVAKVLSVKECNGSWEYELEFPEKLAKYIIHKGSIAINGISLTVAEVSENRLKVAIIPETYENTNIKCLDSGDSVNIELDMLAKYVEKMGLKSN